MNLPDKKIIGFIREHHVLTLATCKDNQPWCANCFYVYLEEENALVFTTDRETRHAREAIANERVAGSIVLETSIIGKIQGIQFTAKTREVDDSIKNKAHKTYLSRFPFALLMNTSLWIAELEYIKMTDNRLGFGKKLIWDKKNQAL